MPKPKKEAPSTEPRPSDADQAQDRTVEDSFPASDPPSRTCIIGPGEPRENEPEHG